MLENDFLAALKEIATRLETNGIRWALVGSSNAAVQGVPVKPHDLDIVIELGMLSKARGIFMDLSPSEIKEIDTSSGVPMNEFVFSIGGFGVEIFGERPEGVYASKLIGRKLVRVSISDFEVACLTLEAEAEAYDETNRGHKAEMIRDYLSRRADNT